MMRLPGTTGLLLLCSAALFACSACRSTDPKEAAPGLPQTTVTITGEGHDPLSLNVEVVASSRGRERGLMFRDDLPDGSGMLFVFESEKEHPFWMKNTLIPLDMIFIDNRHRVVGIIHNAQPKKEESLTVGLPSRFVLEVPGGYCNRVGIHRNDHVNIDL